MRLLRLVSASFRPPLLAVLALFLSVGVPLSQAGASQVKTLAPVVEADGRLGQADVLPGGTPGQASVPWAQLAYDSGARINRWEFRWDRIEPARNVWDFSASDRAVASSEKYGLDVLGILIGTPQWTLVPGQKPGNGLPKGLFRPFNSPRNLWADYVRQTVSHYAGAVKYWEIWNEPDLSFFWSSSARDYYRLLKVAYRSIKEVDPEATVLMGGMVVPDLAFMRHVLGANHADPFVSRPVFDAVAWHIYGPARLAFTNIQNVTSLLRAQNFGSTPVWVTEDGFPASNPNGEDRQAAYVIQTIAYSLAAGAARVLIYRASDDTTNKSWGLVSAQGHPRMGYVTFQVAARYLSHAGRIVYDPTHTAERFTFYQGDVRTTLMWSHYLSDRDIKTFAAQAQSMVIDWLGNASTVQSTAGQIAMTLPGAAYNTGIDAAGKVVGGPPVLIRENNALPPVLATLGLVTPQVPGLRRLALFNPGSTESDVVVSALRQPDERSVVQLPAQSLKLVDLNLLAGPAYSGGYGLAASGPAIASAASQTGSQNSVATSATWYVPRSSGSIEIYNQGASTATVHLVGYGPYGVVRDHQVIHVSPQMHASVSEPVRSLNNPLSLVVSSRAPISVVSPQAATAVPQTSWFMYSSIGGAWAIFNPSPSKSAQVTITSVGTSTPPQTVNVPPLHTTMTPSVPAGFLTSDQPIVLTDRSAVPVTTVASSLPTTDANLIADGSATDLIVANPSTTAAQLTVTIGGLARSSVRHASLAPGTEYTVHVRQPSWYPRSISVQSDVPVMSLVGS